MDNEGVGGGGVSQRSRKCYSERRAFPTLPGGSIYVLRSNPDSFVWRSGEASGCHPFSGKCIAREGCPARAHAERRRALLPFRWQEPHQRTEPEPDCRFEERAGGTSDRASGLLGKPQLLSPFGRFAIADEARSRKKSSRFLYLSVQFLFRLSSVSREYCRGKGGGGGRRAGGG